MVIQHLEHMGGSGCCAGSLEKRPYIKKATGLAAISTLAIYCDLNLRELN